MTHTPTQTQTPETRAEARPAERRPAAWWLFETQADWGPLFLRLTLAVVFFAHGAQKVFGWFGGGGATATMEHFATLGVPGWTAGLVMAAELGGSILLLLGVLTRLGALGILGVMVGAIGLVHYPYGFFMNWQGAKAGEGYEFHLLVIGMCLALIAAGAGRLSIDRQVAHALSRRRTSAA